MSSSYISMLRAMIAQLEKEQPPSESTRTALAELRRNLALALGQGV